jgi:hypothetical protein
MHIEQLRRENTMVDLLAVEFCAVVMSQGVCFVREFGAVDAQAMWFVVFTVW